jgi:thiamine-phosphate pyrophosphorylase
MRSHHLAALARRLNTEAGRPSAPSLFFVTDPERTPDPVEVAKRLPRGAAVIYRHFGAEDRARVARRLAAATRSRGLILLIAADPDLARKVGADGVHWPESLLPAARGDMGREPIGLVRASQIARAAAVPVIALGGVNAETAKRLAGRGFAGLAAVDAFVA